MPEALNAHADGLQACIQAFDKVLPVERVLLFGSVSFVSQALREGETVYAR
jgi:hypothetical protein